jgi:hypothetical protein
VDGLWFGPNMGVKLDMDLDLLGKFNNQSKSERF